jgi:plasmid stabilization system protein ParE
MPRGDKSSYSGKQKRKAEHIEDSYRKRGVSKDEAEERAWRTVNKQDGGAKTKRSSTRSRKTTGSRSRRSTGGRKKAASSRSRK